MFLHVGNKCAKFVIMVLLTIVKNANQDILYQLHHNVLNVKYQIVIIVILNLIISVSYVMLAINYHLIKLNVIKYYVNKDKYCMAINVYVLKDYICPKILISVYNVFKKIVITVI